MPAISAMGTLSRSAAVVGEWANTVPPSTGTIQNTDDDRHLMARIRSVLCIEQWNTSEFVIGAIIAAATPSAARRR